MMNNNRRAVYKMYNQLTKPQSQYVITTKQQRRRNNPTTYHKQYVTRQDRDTVASALSRYMMKSNNGDYYTFMYRGKCSRWIRLCTEAGTVLSDGAIVIDINKIWTWVRHHKKHASIMHKAAHKIKVNALKAA